MQGKPLKRLTFSYDDGVTQDRRLLELFDKYGLKGTFNLNSLLCSTARVLTYNDVSVSQARPMLSEIHRIYKGQEVAAHGLTHATLTGLEDDAVVREIERDREILSDIVGYEVVGMAYPNAGADDRVVRLLKEHTGIRYARMVGSTFNFEPQEDLMRFYPTVHHGQWKELFELADRFIDLKPDKPQIFYIWGHSYELDFEPSWNRLEEFMKRISGRGDIWYCTNREALLDE